MLKNIITHAFQKVCEEKIRLLIGVVFLSITTYISTKVSQYTVKKHMPTMILQMANKTHTTTNIINDKLAELVGKCGEWSGGAWLVYNNKTKIIRFIEVFANDPYYGGIYPTKYVQGNDFYLLEHELDAFAYQKVLGIQEYDVVSMQNDLWLYSKFFQSIQNNIWKITNQKLEKLKIAPIKPQRMYLSTLQFNNELIYIFALTTSMQPYCQLTNTIATENEKIHYTGVALKKLTLEAMEILEVFNFNQ